MQTPESQLIIGRFFHALAYLKERKVIRGKQTFTRRFGINRWNLNTLEKDMSRDMFQVSWLSYLVEEYGVRPEWLLTGQGNILSPMMEARIKERRVASRSSRGSRL